MVGGKIISYEKDHERVVRCNRFVAKSWSERLIELLCNEPYDPLSEYHIIRAPLCDLLQFWWNQCIHQEDMLDEILEDIPAPDYEMDFQKYQIWVKKWPDC